jgi:hypothetical protein
LLPVEGKTVTVCQESETTPATARAWHGSDAATVAQALEVEPAQGLSAEEAGRAVEIDAEQLVPVTWS